MSRSLRPARKPPYLKTLSEECNEPDVAPDLTKAEASKRSALKAKRSPVRPR